MWVDIQYVSLISFILFFYESYKFQMYLFLQCLEPSGEGREGNLLSIYLLSGTVLGALYSVFILALHKNYKVGVILSIL